MVETMSLSEALEFGSPYYLDEDENPQNILSRVKLSEAEDNYAIWKLDFTRVLRIKNKIEFVDGTIEKPEPSSPLYKLWVRCNALVMCWMWDSMTEELCKRVISAETAHKMWEQLRGIFVPNVDLKINQTRRKIAALRQDGDSVEKYFEKVSRAWIELSEYDPVAECKCGGCNCETTKRAKEARDKEECYSFLLGLSKDLSVAKFTIMLMKPLPSLNQAYIMIKRADSSSDSDSDED